MHISFSGAIAPYTYNCPLAFKFRNIDHIYPEIKEEEETTEISKREFGIQQHDLVAKYLMGELDSYEFTTSVIEDIKESSSKIEVEIQRFYNMDMSPINEKPSKGNYISARADAKVIDEYNTSIFDWKFGNPDFGSVRHYDEVEFFVALESATNPEVGEWNLIVHFPEHNYTLPVRTYNWVQAAELQRKFLLRIDNIMADKFLKPKPSRTRCRLCNYKSEEAGGVGNCEYSVL